MAARRPLVIGTDGRKRELPLGDHLPPDALSVEYLQVQDQRADGVSGGGSVSGIQTRELNTVVANSIPGASLASNRITLPAGAYYVQASTLAYAIGEGAQARIYDHTHSADLLIGLSIGKSDYGGDPVQLSHAIEVSGRVELAETTEIQLDLYVQAGDADGLGLPASSGWSEVYTNIEIWRIA